MVFNSATDRANGQIKATKLTKLFKIVVLVIFYFVVCAIQPQKTLAVSVSDNFNRADGGLGNNWTTTTGNAAPQIVSNQMVTGTNGTANSAFWSADTFSDNQYAQATFPNILGGSDGPAVAVRMANSRGYFLWFNNSSTTVSIFRMDSATSWTNIATSNTLTVSNTDVWKIEASGSAILGFQNGNQVVQKTDGTYPTGSPGVWMFYSANQIDNWSAGDLPKNYSLGGTVSGLIGKVVIQNGSTTLNLTNNGTFAFNSSLGDGTSYNVSVQTNPTDQTCTVSNGSGTINAANVTNISITCSGSPPSISATDNFNRADGTLGSNWTDGSDGGLQISSQGIVSNGTSATREDIRTAETYDNNQYSQIEIGNVTGGQWIGPTVRTQNNGQDCYLALYDYNNGSPYVELFKRNGGTFTGLGGQTNVSALASGTKLKIMAVGDTISLLVNGVEKQTAYDNSITGGAPGIMTFDTPSGDNWSGGNAGFEVHYLSTDTNGVESYDMISQNNGHGAHVLRVLRPTNPAAGVPHNFLYLLPVEPEEGTTFGDGINYLRTLDAQNQYNLTIIEPAFVQDPWYADNPTNSDLQYETFMTAELQPWVKANLATTGNEQHWLMGFSKSGIGAMDLFLKHQDLFSLVASWDWPADDAAYDQFSTSSSAQYGTDANFQANYRLTTAFMEAHNSSSLQSQNRIWIGGYNSFQSDVNDFNGMLTAEGILHSTETPTFMTHAWDSGWVPYALAALSQDSTGLLVTPTPTPTSGPSNASTSNSSNTSSSPPNPNVHPNWKYAVDAGPNYVGNTHFISFGNAQTLISRNAVHDDVSVTIKQTSFDDLLAAHIPFPWMQGLNTLGDVYDFSAVSAFNGYPILQFDQPVTIILPYDPLLASSTSLLEIAAYNPDTKKWDILPHIVFDPVDHTIATTIKKFTYFVVVSPANKTQKLTTKRVLAASAQNTVIPSLSQSQTINKTKQNLQQKKNFHKKTCILFFCF